MTLAIKQFNYLTDVKSGQILDGLMTINTTHDYTTHDETRGFLPRITHGKLLFYFFFVVMKFALVKLTDF